MPNKKWVNNKKRWSMGVGVCVIAPPHSREQYQDRHEMALVLVLTL